MLSRTPSLNKLVLTLAVAAPLALSVAFAGSASAAQELPDGCRKDRGKITCETSEPVGMAPESSKAQRVETTETDQGSLNNPAKRTSDCTGPGNSQAQC